MGKINRLGIPFTGGLEAYHLLGHSNHVPCATKVYFMTIMYVSAYTDLYGSKHHLAITKLEP